MQIINEEFKKEIIDSVSKENELKKVSKELAAYVDVKKLEKREIFQRTIWKTCKRIKEEQES